ncbi:hypothetical protein PoB_003876700 [Plakobranchus ocellatus]|uniref:Uncharacterized protein n=1 Tax=Plakobranchus ocellatus TaxID=259542 RepID=A0AAV4AYA0_9GAST|nr:hypothetical protein PoB_003876700 [Plakobranchus ocellatus]
MPRGGLDMICWRSSEARVGLTTSSLPVEVIARKETGKDHLAVTPIRPDPYNDNSLSLSLSHTDSAGNQIQVTSDEKPARYVTDRVLLPVELGSTSAQDTGAGDGQTSNQFDMCPQRLLYNDDVYTEKKSHCASGGQGFTRCNCTGTKKGVGQGDVNAFQQGFSVTYAVTAASNCYNK